MTHLKMIKTGTCAAALLCGTAAMADVTADDVWANWQSSIQVYGDNSITIGAETRDGDTLTISGISMSMDDDITSMTADFGDISFTENGDGTVSVVLADSIPFTITDTDGGTAKISIDQSGVVMLASGEPGAINYAVSADRYAVVVDSITSDDGPVDADIRITGNALVGNYNITDGTISNMAYDMSMDSMDILVDVKDPDTDSKVLMSGKLNGLFVDATMSLPEGVNFEDPDTLFVDGFAIAAKTSLASGDYIFDITENGDQMAGSATTGASNIDVAFSKDGIKYDVSTKDIAMQITPGNMMPFPIDVSLAEYGIGFAMPLSKTDDPQDFRLAINIADLAVNDEIWMMGDPAGNLPHDPATLRLDLSGTMKMLFDVFDPDQAQAMAMADAPTELYDLTLNDLTIDAVGTQVAGTGAFTFDNSDLDTFDGLPRPMGDVTVVVNGANALIDNLIAMGLIPEDQAMMGRMMVGMFAKATGDDELTSEFRIDETGGIYANGQRIR